MALSCGDATAGGAPYLLDAQAKPMTAGQIAAAQAAATHAAADQMAADASMPHGVAAVAAAWARQRYTMTIANQGIADVLSEFAAAAGAPLKIDGALTGVVNESYQDIDGAGFLDALSLKYGFDWRFDGRTLAVTPKSSRVTRLLGLNMVSIKEVERALRALGVYEPKFPLSAYDDQLAYATGPADYVALVELVLADLVARRAEDAARADEARLREAELLKLREEQRQIALERYEARRKEAEARAREAARARALIELRGPVVIRGGVAGG